MKKVIGYKTKFQGKKGKYQKILVPIYKEMGNSGNRKVKGKILRSE